METLTRLIGFEIERVEGTIKQLKKEGGFHYGVVSHRGHISGLNKVLNYIEWYAIKDTVSHYETNVGYALAYLNGLPNTAKLKVVKKELISILNHRRDSK